MSEHRDPALPSMFAMLYQMLAREARKHGYALALHGSMGRDLDVIACPWTEEASAVSDLLEALIDVVDGVVSTSETNPVERPHGRLAWAIHLVGSGTYIDLSVMPKVKR